MVDLAIERNLLCSITDIEHLQKMISDGVTPEHFTQLGEAYTFIKDYYQEELMLPTTGLLTEEFPDQVWEASEGSFNYWYNRFHGAYIYREMAGLLQDNSTTLRDDPAKALERLSDGLNSLRTKGHTVASSSYADRDAMERLKLYRAKRINRRRRLMVEGIPTGLESIDNTGLGWVPGDLVGLVAFSGVGKSWMSTYFACVAWRAGSKVLFISPEMTAPQVELRADVILAHMDGLSFSHTALQRGEEVSLKEYKRFLDSLTEREDFIIKDTTQTMAIDAAVIRSWIHEHSPDLVVVDGLGFMLKDTSGGNQIWSQVKDVAYACKGIASQTETAIILTNQATKDARPDKIPRLDQCAFGMGFVHAADRIICMARNRNNENQRLWHMEKNRNAEAIFTDRYLNWQVDTGDIHEIPVEVQR